jgi:hypothetical protein
VELYLHSPITPPCSVKEAQGQLLPLAYLGYFAVVSAAYVTHKAQIDMEAAHELRDTVPEFAWKGYGK